MLPLILAWLLRCEKCQETVAGVIMVKPVQPSWGFTSVSECTPTLLHLHAPAGDSKVPQGPRITDEEPSPLHHDGDPGK